MHSPQFFCFTSSDLRKLESSVWGGLGVDFRSLGLDLGEVQGTISINFESSGLDLAQVCGSIWGVQGLIGGSSGFDFGNSGLTLPKVGVQFRELGA